MRKAMKHLQTNAIAYLALFIALGGTSYAAINLPAGSVGNRQLKNHSITPVKFDGRYINGTVRAWALVRPDGAVQSSGGEASARVEDSVPGFYLVKWKKVATPSNRSCFAFAGIQDSAAQAASAEANLFVSYSKPPRQWVVDVNTYGAEGQRQGEYFYTAVVC